MHLELTIEKSLEGQLWGRVLYDDNLIVDSADSLESLKDQMKALLKDFHDVEPDQVDFAVTYDLTAFFDQFSFLKVSKIAEKAGLNPSLVRHYSAGTKNPSTEQVKRIEAAIHSLAEELLHVQLA